MLAAGNNTILSAFNDATFENTDNGYLTGVSVSTDGGQSFVDQGKLPPTPTGDAGDPVLARDAVTGRVYLATLSFRDPTKLLVFHSDDNGTTFSQPVNGAPGIGSADKEWLAVDNNGGGAQGYVYLIVRDFGGGNGIYLYRSTDQGATFGAGVQIASGASFNVQGAYVTVGPDSTVYAFWFVDSFGGGAPQPSIMMRKSMDFGLTFGAPVTVATLTPSTTGYNGDLGMNFRTNRFPQAVVNPVNNDIYVSFANKAGLARSDVFLAESTDGGATWGAPVKINDDTTMNDHWNPALAVTPNGASVGVFWYDRRNDPANQLIDRFGAIGSVSGHTVTFAPNFQITDQAFPEEFGHLGGIVSNYMGDYDQAVATTTFFYLTWEDNRLPSQGHPGHRQDVRFAAIPLATAGGAVIASSPRGNVTAPVDHIRFTFDESMRPHSFEKINQSIMSFTDPNGNAIPVLSVTPVPGSNNTMFDVAFNQQTQVGTYTMVIGPKIRDKFGREMDQNGDGIPGQIPDDEYTATFTIQGPSVLSTTLTGTFNNQVVDHGRIVFNASIDPNSFSFDQFVLQDPHGNTVNVLSITPVGGTNDTQFDVTFDPQSGLGAYTLTVGPNITDMFGNPLTAAFVSHFIITNELLINGGFETGDFTAWTQSGNTGSTSVAGDHPHSGRYAADLGPVGSDGFIAQRFATTPGASYTLIYWLSNGGDPPNDFAAYIDGVIVPGSLVQNASAFGYREYMFTFVATNTMTELKFGFRQDPSYFYLDDASVTPVGTGPSGGSGGSAALGTADAVLARSGGFTPAVSAGSPVPTSTAPPNSVPQADQGSALDQAFLPTSGIPSVLALRRPSGPELAVPFDWKAAWDAIVKDENLVI